MVEKQDYIVLTNEQHLILERYKARKMARAMTLGEFKQVYLNLSGFHNVRDEMRPGALLRSVIRESSKMDDPDKYIEAHYRPGALVDILLDKISEQREEIERLKNVVLPTGR